MNNCFQVFPKCEKLKKLWAAESEQNQSRAGQRKASDYGSCTMADFVVATGSRSILRVHGTRVWPTLLVLLVSMAAVGRTAQTRPGGFTSTQYASTAIARLHIGVTAVRCTNENSSFVAHCKIATG